MKKFLVKIDRGTFRKNSRAGETQTKVFTSWNCTVIVTGSVWVPEHLEHGYMLIERHTPGNEEKHCYQVACEDSLKRLEQALTDAGVMNSDISVIKDQNTKTETHPPLPNWDFHYVPTEVECSSCGEKFPHTHLVSQSDFDGFYYTESDEICPHCGQVDCCEVEYEQPQDVADELFIV